HASWSITQTNFHPSVDGEALAQSPTPRRGIDKPATPAPVAIRADAPSVLFANSSHARDQQLAYRDHQSVEIGGDDQPRLATCEFQDRTILVGQHDPTGARTDRDARASGSVNAIHIGWPTDVAHGTDEIGCRAAKRKAVAYSADGKPIALAMKHQRSAAGRAANNQTRLDNIEPYAATIGVDAGREPGAGHGHGQSKQRGTNWD